MKNSFFYILFLVFFISFFDKVLCEDVKVEKQENVVSHENNESGIKFDSIKKVLQKDMLQTVIKKQEVVKKKNEQKKIQKKLQIASFPKESDFFHFLSEYYLVKNGPILKWDFVKPDYGIEESFAAFLEAQGLYEKKFSILLLDSVNICHAALPTRDGEYLLLLSAPFIRTLNLSKLEISLLLYSNVLRSDAGLIKDKVITKELKSLFGKPMKKNHNQKKILDAGLKKYDEILLEKGFSFQEQFDLAKKLETTLKNDLKLWQAYLELLKKIDELVKTNLLYSNYIKIYPTPEMELNWLRPKKE